MVTLQKRQDSQQATLIRAASSKELSDYEKNKLASVEDGAQQNKLDGIRINGNRVPIDKNTKIANINVGDLAFKSAVTSNDIDNNELFFIKCSLD
jgi:hypothetical protein